MTNKALDMITCISRAPRLDEGDMDDGRERVVAAVENGKKGKRSIPPQTNGEGVASVNTRAR